MHEEIIAQRALDRRLTEELLQFKTTISYLTELAFVLLSLNINCVLNWSVNLNSELTHVKQHDKMISEQAGIYQKDVAYYFY